MNGLRRQSPRAKTAEEVAKNVAPQINVALQIHEK